MRTFNEWLYDLNESITFQIADISSQERMGDDFPNIVNELAKKLRQQMFVDDFTAATEASGLSYYQLIEMSDNYFSNPDQLEIHFWAGFFPEPSRKKILDAILYLLPEFHLELKNTVQSKQLANYNAENKYGRKSVLVYEIPVGILQNTAQAAPSVNVASANAHELLKMLNLDTGYEYGTINVHDLSIRLASLTDFHKDMATRSPETSANFIGFGLDQNQLQRYINDLEKMVQWAMSNNYDTISYS